MNPEGTDVERFDAWLEDDSDSAALVMRQGLEPVEGKDAVIFPPTYPVDGNKAGYNIDKFSDGSTVCQVDSVGSQANRMEPIFKREKYRHLVPQVVIRAGERDVHLLDAGHRAADAIVRFSTLGPELHEAFRAYREEGDAEPLARIAPTSIVFGSWDSRSTQVKLPRVVRSVIRAYNVDELTRSAQYSTIAGEILEAGEVEVTTKGPKAELGLAHVPAVRTHGGVQVRGEIRRDAVLNLAALRAVAGADEARTKALRRYILGLSLVALTAPQETSLREGCELVPDPARERQWTVVKHDGSRAKRVISHDDALAFATAAAGSFGVRESQVGAFDSSIAKRVLALKEEDRKRLLRQGPVTKEAIEALGLPVLAGPDRAAQRKSKAKKGPK
jgi:CRISPR-associated protein Csb1